MSAAERFKVKTAAEYLNEMLPTAIATAAKEAAVAAVDAMAAREAKPANSDWLDIPANRVQSASEFAGALTAREWDIKGVQPTGAELCVIYGESGSGKSFLLTDMLTCVHLGRPWNGRKTRQRRVVRVVAEGAHDARYRDHALALSRGVALDALPGVIDNAPSLRDSKQAADVVKQIKAAGGCDVLLIDTLSATFRGNENSGEELGEYIHNIKLMQRALCCTVWIVHHAGKDASKGARGWSGLRAALDVELEVIRKKDDDARCMEVSKAKGGRDGDRFGFKLPFVALGRDADGEDFGSCRVEYTDAPARLSRKLGKEQQRVIDALADLCRVDGKPVSLLRLMDRFPTEHRSDVERVLKKLSGPQHERVLCSEGLYSMPAELVRGSAKEFDK